LRPRLSVPLCETGVECDWIGQEQLGVPSMSGSPWNPVHLVGSDRDPREGHRFGLPWGKAISQRRVVLLDALFGRADADTILRVARALRASRRFAGRQRLLVGEAAAHEVSEHRGRVGVDAVVVAVYEVAGDESCQALGERAARGGFSGDHLAE
jgi:hypothetical protein